MTTIISLNNKHPVNLDNLEEEIQSEMHRTITPALPPYVNHNPVVDAIGQLSAEAIVQQYEEAAKAFEAMGADLIDCAKKAEKMAADVKFAIEFVAETAQAYRNEAKIVFERIEAASLLTSQVKEVCEEMRKKIGQ